MNKKHRRIEEFMHFFHYKVEQVFSYYLSTGTALDKNDVSRDIDPTNIPTLLHLKNG